MVKSDESAATMRGGTGGPQTDYIMDPIYVSPKCDPLTSIDWCDEGDDDGGACVTGSEPVDPAYDAVYVSGCAGLGGGGGGGAVGGQETPGEDECNPQYDPECNQPLTSSDSTMLRKAFAKHIRAASQFTDPAKAQQCAALKNEFDRLLAAGIVFRGGFEAGPNDPNGTSQHVRRLRSGFQDDAF
jgi:hypothetical protein